MKRILIVILLIVLLLSAGCVEFESFAKELRQNLGDDNSDLQPYWIYGNTYYMPQSGMGYHSYSNYQSPSKSTNIVAPSKPSSISSSKSSSSIKSSPVRSSVRVSRGR